MSVTPSAWIPEWLWIGEPLLTCNRQVVWMRNKLCYFQPLRFCIIYTVLRWDQSMFAMHHWNLLLILCKDLKLYPNWIPSKISKHDISIQWCSGNKILKLGGKVYKDELSSRDQTHCWTATEEICFSYLSNFSHILNFVFICKCLPDY